MSKEPDRHTSFSEGDHLESASFDIPEMDCPSCAEKVTKSVEKLDGIEKTEARPTSGMFNTQYDPARTDSEAIADRIEAAGYTIKTPETERVDTFEIPEMDCPSCAGKVGNALDAVRGIVEYDLQPTTGTATVTYDSEITGRSDVITAVEGAGYEVANAEAEADGDHTDDRSIWWSSRAIKTWISGAFLILGALIEYLLTAQNVSLLSIPSGDLLVSDALMLVGIVAGGEVILRNGYYSAKNRSLDMDFLMSTAIISATGASLLFPVGLYFEAIVVAFFFNVAELLESYSVNRARASLKELMELSPETAVVRRDGVEREVSVDEIEVGEVVFVKPGKKIPMDGEVTDGESAVNQAPITGESVPVDKRPGDEVYAGTINEQGFLEIEVTSVASESTIARVIEMVENAQANKTKREQFVDRFAGYYTPIVVTFALLTAFVPPVLFGAAWDTWFVRGIALLVIACPCAFVISTPVSVVSGITSAARNGVLIKGGNYLELMGEVDAIAFDKTGTLTKGELAVTDIVSLNGNTEEDVLQCARGLEQRSEHPIGDAIIDHADEHGIEEMEIEAFESITGKGVRATLNGVTHYAGKPSLFEELGFNLDHIHVATDGGVLMDGQPCEHGKYLDLADGTIPRLQREGKTVVLIGTEDELQGVIAIADEVRPDAQTAIEGLHDAGIEHLIMLTGDNEGTAKAITEQVGVDEYHAELLPEDKVTAIEELVEEYGTVAMVGDGINDAPAMATASVGIAMGAAGTDTALETADIALMADDLSKLPYLYELSHTANGVIRQNIWGALAAEALLALGVPLGLVSVLLAVVVGDVGMTVGVTGNAMRLSRINPE